MTKVRLEDNIFSIIPGVTEVEETAFAIYESKMALETSARNIRLEARFKVKMNQKLVTRSVLTLVEVLGSFGGLLFFLSAVAQALDNFFAMHDAENYLAG
mmetsp:Transcript_33497/g.41345  ORF Transcript_33497/g.41345 Transcript_33497/m.41345 type:complete len:100 (+) Transcript_33497:194-493(+)